MDARITSYEAGDASTPGTSATFAAGLETASGILNKLYDKDDIADIVRLGDIMLKKGLERSTGLIICDEETQDRIIMDAETTIVTFGYSAKYELPTAAFIASLKSEA